MLERKGVIKDGVYVVTVPRDDLDVTIEGMGIPTAAGIESVFYFYRCPCGKMNVAGQFVTADYEANDVADALRQGQLKITSIGPLLLYEKPRLLVVRFQAEGDAVLMAKALREALRWTAAERMAPQKLEGDK
ncbi:MAG: peptidase [Phycisphaerales bacterium]|nr:peptidase [Phycisphaerales bacterium]